MQVAVFALDSRKDPVEETGLAFFVSEVNRMSHEISQLYKTRGLAVHEQRNLGDPG